MYDFVDDKPELHEHETVEDLCEGAALEAVDGEPDFHPETRHTSEFSFDLHGKNHPDALYRAAGGESDFEDGGRMQFGCPCCGRTVGRVIRVRPTRKSAWQAVCAMCAASTLAKHPEALIGGVVRAGRRRRRRLRDAG